LAAVISSKACLLISLYLYLFIITLGFFMQTTLHFYILAILVSLVLGGSQAISRSIFSRMIPEKQTAEFFSLFGLSGKFAAVIGQSIIAIIAHTTGSSRYGIGALAILFIIGIIIVSKLDEKKAREEAGLDIT